MSRSYRNRKNDKICRDHMKTSSHGKQYKKFANKKVRGSKDLKNGNMYKKVYSSWNIHDYTYHIKNLPKDWKTQSWCRYFMCK